ncbi:hypothetical protein AYI69_g11473 [Smittium culicis]|uniref:Uncharacterized protein n=1 Tax=Smittium culicis TaxID=133412 RepID=A0A1R1WYE6_9FUNG|nr:hypothetical protein AYI69_g11473 [Smittium culicis]
MKHKNQQNLLQAAQAGVQNQGREIIDNTETIYHAFRDVDQRAGHEAESSQIQGRGPALGGLQVIEYMPNFAEGLGEFHRESSRNSSGFALGRLMLRRLLELKNTSLTTLKSWTVTVTLTEPVIQNLEFWKEKLSN